MVKRIADHLNFDLLQKKKSFQKTKEYYTQKEQPIFMDGVVILIKITEEDYDKLHKNVVLDEKDYVPVNEAEKWLNTNLVCKPTKQDLDDQREGEINSLDLM